MQGNLSQISLNDLLLLATGGKKSGVLKLSRGKETVELYLNAGEIIHATCPIGDGEKALLYPVTWGEGTFALLPNGTSPAPTIRKNSAQILDEVKAMSREWETILEVIPTGKTVFRLADLGDEQSGPITVPYVGWRVLTKIDGMRNVQEIAEILRVPYAYTAKVIFNLHKAGLVEIVTPAAKTVSERVAPALFNRIASLLTEIIGPIARVVVHDQIEALGERENNFPEARLEELIGLLSKEISDAQSKARFQQLVAQEVASLKKL
jgi:hypothetical protein